jgi:uncharacterized lipoprotein YmbA
MRWTVLVAAATLAATTLAGCASSPAIGWHSLVPAAAALAPSAAASAPASTTLMITAVTVPDEVDRPQLVVRGPAGTPALLDGERWSEPLKAQLPRALALGLAARLPQVLVVAAPGNAVPVPAWRLVVDVQRFELQGGRAVLRAVWVLRPGVPRDAAAPAPQLFEASVPVAGAGPAAQVAAMGRALDELAGRISRSACLASGC